jgi:hypothetical protein
MRSARQQSPASMGCQLRSGGVWRGWLALSGGRSDGCQGAEQKNCDSHDGASLILKTTDVSCNELSVATVRLLGGQNKWGV